MDIGGLKTRQSRRGLSKGNDCCKGRYGYAERNTHGIQPPSEV